MSNVMRCSACDLVITSEPSATGKAKACPRCGKAMTQRVADPLVGRSIAGCRLVRRLGMGAMAVVYEAEQLSDHQRVAIKMLTNDAAKDAENGRRFAREAQLCKSLAHPNVVAVQRHGNENGIHFMIMELVDGAAMESVIDRQGAMAWRQIAHLILQIGQALDHIGKQGIIHRDIKPANILLTKGGVAKLVDLGFAKKLTDGDSDLPQAGDLTMQGVSMGSPAYMPPEQVLDAKQATHSADVYSLGATFFHAVTGQTPFNGKTAYEIMEKVLKHPAPSPRTIIPDIPIAISQLIEWSMEKDPERRPASAAEFVRELEVAMFAPDDAQRIRRLRRSQNKAWILPVVIGGAVLVVGGLLWFLLRAH